MADKLLFYLSRSKKTSRLGNTSLCSNWGLAITNLSPGGGTVTEEFENGEDRKLLKTALAGRRQAVFGASVLLAGFSIVIMCFCPVVFPLSSMTTLFSTEQQEAFFFDIFGFISASWLLCWVASLNGWNQSAKIGQWLGLVCLCVDQVNLLGIWHSLSESQNLLLGVWVTPSFLQIYLLGSFFGFFTLPGLTRDGNRTLTGLGTLVLLLPWLIGRDEIIAGTQILHGMFSAVR